MRHRAELAEQKAELLERQVDDMRTAMRMLEAGPARPPAATVPPSRRRRPPEPAPQPRRRWWQRKPIVAGASLTVGAAEAAEKVGWVMEHMPSMTSAADDDELL